jgi:RimJ/RimL family protein N-acetyltransferase
MAEEDLPVLFESEVDQVAREMAAFTAEKPLDWESYNARWGRIQADPRVLMKTILVDGQIAGSVGSYVMEDKRQVCYWILREHWGKGIATMALSKMLESDVVDRPVYGAAAADNLGSIQVLKKCGFVYHDKETSFAYGRGQELEELTFILM